MHLHTLCVRFFPHSRCLKSLFSFSICLLSLPSVLEVQACPREWQGVLPVFEDQNQSICLSALAKPPGWISKQQGCVWPGLIKLAVSRCLKEKLVLSLNNKNLPSSAVRLVGSLRGSYASDECSRLEGWSSRPAVGRDQGQSSAQALPADLLVSAE